jgi:hypothetical protein
MKNSFYLVIPEQQDDADRLKMFEEVSLQRWLDELPTANPGLTVKLFRDLIEEFISLHMDIRMRLNVLEKLRPSHSIIQEYLRSRLMLAGFPKTENDIKTFDVLVEIEKAVAIAYWMVAKSLTRSREIGWFKTKNVALSLERVIKGLSDVATDYYMMALRIPDWVWIDLHSLYKLSVKLKKEAIRVPDETAIFNKSSSPLDSYLRIILLSLSGPDGLMPKEIVQVFQFVEKVVSYVTLELKPIAGQTRQCVIFVDEDKPPMWLNNDANLADSHVQYVNFSKLFKAFKSIDKFVNPADSRFSSMTLSGNKPERISQELFDYLQSRWSGVKSRGTPLFGDRLNRYFSIGLDPAHDLQKALQRDPEVDMEYFAESASERSLLCKFEKCGVLSIGSLISFRREDIPEHKRSLGVICRIPITKADGRVEFEVKALTMQVHAVNYLPIGADKKETPLKALIYGVKEGEEEKSFLIIESFLYKDEDLLRLFIGGENFPIVLRDRRNVGLGYWQFECRRVAEHMVPRPDAPKKGYDFI